MADNDGIHAAHCCSRHGCKYGERRCPVVWDGLKQEYPCEQCDDEAKELEATADRLRDGWIERLRSEGYTVIEPS